jgi:ribose transport system permease protein
VPGGRPLTARFRDLLEQVPIVQVLAAVLLYGVIVLTIRGFGGWPSLMALLVLAAFLGIASVGQTAVVLLGGLDLSIPILIGMANVAICELTGGRGWPFLIAFVAVIGVAAAIGAASGFISRHFRIHSLLVTIGTAAIVTGAVRALAPGGGRATAPAPAWLGTFTSPAGTTGPIPVPPVLLLWLVIIVGVTLLLKRTEFGRQLYATGSNLRAARLTWVPTTRIWTATFALSAAFAALTGILLAGFTGQGVIFAGEAYLFGTIACVVIGGTSLQGGSGDYLRTVVGAVILTELTTLFSGLGLDSPSQQVLLGVLIVLVVLIYGREDHVRNRV